MDAPREDAAGLRAAVSRRRSRRPKPRHAPRAYCTVSHYLPRVAGAIASAVPLPRGPLASLSDVATLCSRYCDVHCFSILSTGEQLMFAAGLVEYGASHSSRARRRRCLHASRPVPSRVLAHVRRLTLSGASCSGAMGWGEGDRRPIGGRRRRRRPSVAPFRLSPLAPPSAAERRRGHVFVDERRGAIFPPVFRSGAVCGGLAKRLALDKSRVGA